MNRAIRLVPVVLLAFVSLAFTTLALAPGSAAQEPFSGDSGQVAAELARLNETLEQVQNLLAQQVETQTLDLLLKRAQLVSGEVAQLDTQLRQARSERDELDDQRIQMQAHLEAARDSNSDISFEDLENMTRYQTIGLHSITRRLTKVDTEIIEVQNRLDNKQRDLDDWRDLLDRRLSGV